MSRREAPSNKGLKLTAHWCAPGRLRSAAADMERPLSSPRQQAVGVSVVLILQSIR